MGGERDEPGPRPAGEGRPRPTFEPVEGAVVGDKYRLERVLAGGGMGSVWIALHLKLDAKVAIKFMARELLGTPSALARFEREAKASAKLSSPHVVKVHDFGVEDGMPFMVMELLLGEDLGARFDRVGRLGIAEAADVAVAVGKALRAAHEVGLVHRDLKPRNVFLATQGGETVVKLLDFGIARETKTQLVEDRTSSGLVLGSPYHMAPEQAQGMEVDHRADLWALGVVLYRALTGQRPFEAESVTLVLFAICTRRHADPTTIQSDLPAGLDAFFTRVLAKNPEGRFDSAAELVDAFLLALGRPRPKEDDPSGSRGHGPVSGALRPADDAVSARTPATGTGVTGGLHASGSPEGGRSDVHGSGGRDVAASSSKDLSASRALSAVSTGVVPIQVVSPFARRTVIAGAIVAVGLVAFLVVRGVHEPSGASSAVASGDPASTATASSATEQSVVSPVPAPPRSDAPVVAPSAPAVDAAVASASPSGSAAVPVPRTTRAAGGGSTAAAPARPPPSARPPAAPKIDPFTGLPVGP